MKKIIALLAIVSVFGFVACNNAAETESTEETTEVADSMAATEETATEEAPAEEAATEEVTDSTATEEAPAEEAAAEEAAE